MFKKLLVANRGEIALRITRACREMGIASVAVYSDVDRNALHVRQADEAYLLGAAPPRDSYLNIEKILAIARECAAEAIHPGYGFLAENTAFAEACRRDGIVLVGPPPEAMRLMGDKLAARRTAREAGVPVVPGSEAPVGKSEAQAAARKVGYPVLIKAAAGGGGKGIRLVRSAREVEAALRISSSEAASAFGDGAVYVEKCLEPVRHVEVQVLADNAGHVVALGERECSIQRRHQKLIEESPSTAVDEDLRLRMCEAAIAVTRAAGYHSAGTVEFLLDSEGEFYFLEMNTRLQVEHPVTELVTGIDLVVEQIRIAAGGRLALRQEEIELSGWALECRIAAEDPFNDFMPSLGRIDYVSEPSGPGIRVDSALYPGVELPYHYDPMVAKVIVWGRTRDEAVQRMRRALGEFRVIGVETNIPFHLQVLTDPRFLAGKLSTTFVEGFTMSGRARDADERVALLAGALLTHLKRRRAAPTTGAAPPADGSAWRAAGRIGILRSGVRKGGRWRSIG